MDKPADPATPFREVYQHFLAVLKKHGNTRVEGLDPSWIGLKCRPPEAMTRKNRATAEQPKDRPSLSPVAGDSNYPPSTKSFPPMPGCKVQTNAYSPGSGALNSIVSEAPGATTVDVAA